MNEHQDASNDTPEIGFLADLAFLKKLGGKSQLDNEQQSSNNDTPEIGFLAELNLLKKYGGRTQVNVVPPGRAYFVAHLPDSLSFYELRQRFYDIMVNLTYKEAMAWCRAFGYSYATYLMRRYQHRSPKMEEVIMTVEWYDNGKPMTRKNRTTVAAFDRFLEGVKKLNTLGGSAQGSSTNLGAEYPL